MQRTFDHFSRLIRDNVLCHIALCGALGMLVGAVTLGLHKLVLWFHQTIFVLAPTEHLSTGAQSDWAILFVPAMGGGCLALFRFIVNAKRHEIVDPIEANALYGGRMSMRDSLRLAFTTLLSNAAGASVGMEAAYTQMGASLHSLVGHKLHLRREDLRVVLAAGAAAAIAAAFNAPLAGAFYGFELILGSYSVLALSQVSAAALAGVLFVRLTGSENAIFSLPAQTAIEIPLWEYPLLILLGAGAAFIGIQSMKMVTRFEHLAQRLPVHAYLRPIIGGILLSLLAIIFPQILGNGQGAINQHLQAEGPFFFAAMALLIAKMLGSAISIGMGFRGGLFSSSLLLGCLYGQCIGSLANHLLPETNGQMAIFMLVGMGAVGASIIGAPVTMTLLVLEMTGDFTATTAVLAGVLVSSAITRHMFGYSFSTWRFHLRGLSIRGAADIGWINDLTVASIMREDAKTAPSTLSLVALRELAPIDSAKYLIITDEEGKYQGVIDVATLHTEQPSGTPEDINRLIIGQSNYLLPAYNIQTALQIFDETQMEALPVVMSPDDLRVIGFVTESYALRRYAKALENRQLDPYGLGKA